MDIGDPKNSDQTELLFDFTIKLMQNTDILKIKSNKHEIPLYIKICENIIISYIIIINYRLEYIIIQSGFNDFYRIYQ